MLKRVVAVPLWFISIWFAFGLAVYPLGLPADGGAVLGALLAALVWMDPTGAFWGPKRGGQNAARAAGLGTTAPSL
jgi:hypothetical protein